MTTSFREIRLPEALCAAAEQKFGDQFGGLENFLLFVLKEMLQEKASDLDRAEQQMIEARLRDLGYI